VAERGEEREPPPALPLLDRNRPSHIGWLVEVWALISVDLFLEVWMATQV
jgi:hypothetical protein